VDSNQERELVDLLRLYARLKRLVLMSEQVDPESRSNIAVFKEQRDALDHVMRALSQALGVIDEQKPAGYFSLHLDKATGHLLRAAYDALDGLAVSCKLRISELMQGICNEAIHDAFPDYYNHVVEIDRIDQRIAEHRNAKDVGDDHTTKNLDDYLNEVSRLCEMAKECQAHLPAMLDWQKRDWRQKLREKLFWPLLICLIGAVVAWILK